jgi:hypothetical protein
MPWKSTDFGWFHRKPDHALCVIVARQSSHDICELVILEKNDAIKVLRFADRENSGESGADLIFECF